MKLIDKLFKRNIKLSANYSDLQAQGFLSSGVTQSGQYVTEESALKLSAVYACIRILAESCGSLPLMLYRRDGSGRKERAYNHGLYHLIHDAPNPFMDSITFFELMVGHCALRGNSFAKIERDGRGDVTAIYPLLPQNMSVKIENNTLIYDYSSSTYQARLRPYEVLHLKGLSFDGIIGMSPISTMREVIGRCQAVNEYANRYFSNDARPNGILTHPNVLSETALQTLKNSWKSNFSGENRHSTAILEEGMKFESVGLSPQDSQLIDAQKFSVIDVARAFRIPPNLLQDHERSTYSNVTEQNRSFVIHTMLPWLKRIEQACNRTLLTESERKSYYFEHKLDNLLRGDQKTRYECYEIGLKNGFLSKNDVRNFENMTPVEGGDSYLNESETQKE